jgi:hypothetical protein
LFQCFRTLRPIQVCRYYRQLQILNVQFNDCFQPLIMPLTFPHFLVVTTLLTYASVRQLHAVQFLSYLPYPMGTLACTTIFLDTFPPAVAVYEASENLINQAAHFSAGQKCCMSRFMKSCKPLSIFAGHFFPIKQSTTITYGNVVMEYTIMLLLNF